MPKICGFFYWRNDLDCLESLFGLQLTDLNFQIRRNPAMWLNISAQRFQREFTETAHSL